MSTTFSLLTPIALLLVLGVLVAGLLNMARGGSANLSQTLMRWRVALQFAAIVVIMLAVLVLRK